MAGFYGGFFVYIAVTFVTSNFVYQVLENVSSLKFTHMTTTTGYALSFMPSHIIWKVEQNIKILKKGTAQHIFVMT